MTQRNDGGWCECSAKYGCGRRFGGLTGFDAHRIMLKGEDYDWRCATDAELEKKGYAKDQRGYWRRTWEARPTLPASPQTAPAVQGRQRGAA